MRLDFVTLMAITATNLCMLSAALPLIMGRGAGTAARWVQASLLLQGLPGARHALPGPSRTSHAIAGPAPALDTGMVGSCRRNLVVLQRMASQAGVRPSKQTV